MKIRKTAAIFLFCFASLFLSGCAEDFAASKIVFDISADVSSGDIVLTPKWKTGFCMEYLGSFGIFEEYRDSETGVHYLVCTNEAGQLCVCPRYDAAGQIYVD